MTRRELLIGSAALPATRAASSRPALCLFSKHLPKHGYEDLARACRQFGFDGIDLTVRPGGHVLPENVGRDLPAAVRIIRGHGLSVPMITTGLLSASDPAAEPTFAAAAGLKIPYLKPGYWRYRGADVLEAIERVRRDAEGLVALAARHGLAVGFHNHSGDFVGTAVWDTWAIIAGMDAARAGFYFDPCHATAEGGYEGWAVALNLALRRLKMIALKDFYWEKREGKWRMKWCPLGEGMVDWDRFFSTIAKAGFAGPVSLHVEYEPADEMAAIAADLAFMRKMTDKHYGG